MENQDKLVSVTLTSEEWDEVLAAIDAIRNELHKHYNPQDLFTKDVYLKGIERKIEEQAGPGQETSS